MGEFINICASHCVGCPGALVAVVEQSWGRAALLGVLGLLPK